MKKIILLLIFGITFTNVNAQKVNEQESKPESPIEFNAGLQTNHLWRGLVITDKPMISAQIGLNLNKSKTLQLGIWGGTSLSNDSDDTHYKEINYYIQYSNKGLTLGLWDLFNTRGVKQPDIWDYNEKTTTHIIDFRSSYQFQGNFPLRLEADVLLYGSADSERKSRFSENNLIIEREQRYSTYVQASYPVIKGKEVDLDLFAGTGFSLNGKTHLYGNEKHNFDAVNVGFTAKKDVKVFDHKIPVKGTVLWNPSNKIARVQLAVPLF